MLLLPQHIADAAAFLLLLAVHLLRASSTPGGRAGRSSRSAGFNNCVLSKLLCAFRRYLAGSPVVHLHIRKSVFSCTLSFFTARGPAEFVLYRLALRLLVMTVGPVMGPLVAFNDF